MSTSADRDISMRASLLLYKHLQASAGCNERPSSCPLSRSEKAGPGAPAGWPGVNLEITVSWGAVTKRKCRDAGMLRQLRSTSWSGVSTALARVSSLQASARCCKGICMGSTATARRMAVTLRALRLGHNRLMPARRRVMSSGSRGVRVVSGSAAVQYARSTVMTCICETVSI